MHISKENSFRGSAERFRRTFPKKNNCERLYSRGTTKSQIVNVSVATENRMHTAKAILVIVWCPDNNQLLVTML